MPTIDPYWNNVVFLMQPSGAVGSTSFVDVKGHAISSFGNVRHESAPSGLFGGTCAYFDGTDDRLQIDSNDLILGTGDWTIESWFRTPTVNLYNVLFKLGTASDTWNFYAYRNFPNGKISVGIPTSSGGASSIESSNGYTDNAWQHLAISKTASVIRAYLNGVIFSQNMAHTASLPQTRLMIGEGPGIGSDLSGYIGPFRITKGVGRYTANSIDVPTEPFPAIGARIAGTVRDESGILCARTVRSYDRSTGILLGSTTSNATTGAFEFYSANADPQTVIVLDDDAGTTLDPIVYDRVIPEVIV